MHIVGREREREREIEREREREREREEIGTVIVRFEAIG
jgi:hypothetical protein